MVNIKEYADKIYALRELPVPKIITESNKIVDDLTREVCDEYGIPFRLPVMIILRRAKERLFDDHWCILFGEKELKFITQCVRKDIDSLFEKYPGEVVKRAFDANTFVDMAKPSLDESLHGGVELLERACEKIMGR